MSKVHQLRQLLGQENTIPHFESLECPGLDQGLPKGKISEVSGTGRVELVARILAEHRTKTSAWVKKKFDLYPTALQQRQVNLQKLLFIEAGSQIKWSLLQLLNSQLFEILVAPYSFKNINDLRQLQLSCERSKCCLLLLSEVSQPAWPISLRIQMSQNKIIKQHYKQMAL